jgi:hypothetical protein
MEYGVFNQGVYQSSTAAAWLYQCQLMAFQFVIINPLLTLVPLILKYSRVSDFNKIPMIVEVERYCSYCMSFYSP